jgi:hypothetical protein
VVPTIIALRQRLDELCQQELQVLRKEFGPFTEDQDQALAALTTHITQRIAGSLARELKRFAGTRRARCADGGGGAIVSAGNASGSGEELEKRRLAFGSWLLAVGF